MTCLFTKIYGERNTGATYLEKLINKNFATDILRGDFGVDKRVLRLVLNSTNRNCGPPKTAACRTNTTNASFIPTLA